MSRVPEVINPLVAIVVRLSLGNFVVMVRESQINASRVNINGELFEDCRRHGRALNVPSRTTLAPGRIPRRFPFFDLFPQGKILRILLVSGCVANLISTFSLSKFVNILS